MSTRHRALERFQSETFDLAIIGGGITGAGVARDAASRGLKVALVEAHDFASGTSSRSSKLIHGGIRYLENLEFGLVFEALSERQRLFEMAPHLVHPLRFVLPVYRGGRVPVWKLGLGMWAYDALSLFEAPELNQHLSVGELEREFPALRSQGLDGGFAYYDAYMDDDRLVLETLRSAQNMGAAVANYVEARGVQFKNGQVYALECEDKISSTRFPLCARHFVSTVGPWTDRVGADFFPDWRRRLRPSKGVHLTFNKSRFPLQDAVVMAAENRIVFAIPRYEMVIVGTTDTDYPGDPAQVRAEKEDIDYLLRVTDRYFPGAGLTKDDIVACYAGVRPLIDDGSQTESKTSREHEIWTNSYGMTFVAGGKYTTYRNMAEQTVKHVLQNFSIEEQVQFGVSRTLVSLNPLVTPDLHERARRECFAWAKDWAVPIEIAHELAERHGMEGERIGVQALEMVSEFRSAPDVWLWCAEALFAMEQTMCLNLTDFYFRRTHLILAREDHGRSVLPPVAATMARHLGWNSERIKMEINALQNQINWDLGAAISS